MTFLVRNALLVYVLVPCLASSARIGEAIGLGRIVKDVNHDDGAKTLNAPSPGFLRDTLPDSEDDRIAPKIERPVSSGPSTKLENYIKLDLRTGQDRTLENENLNHEILKVNLSYAKLLEVKVPSSAVISEESLIPEIKGLALNNSDQAIHEQKTIEQDRLNRSQGLLTEIDPAKNGTSQAEIATGKTVFEASSPPAASDLKLSPSHIQEANSIFVFKQPTENNNIIPQIFPTQDTTIAHVSIKSNTEDEKQPSSVEPLTVVTSAPPKRLKNKIMFDKQPEAKGNSIEDKWRDLEKTFRSYTDTVMKRALPKFLRIHSQLNISSQCNSALIQMTRGLRSLKSWAIKMVDASGRLPSGSLEGTLTDLGDYDQCLDVTQASRHHHSAIKGQYCTLELKPTLPALHNSVTLNTKVLDFGNASKDSVLSDLSDGSALFHFMVMRIGICVPSPCESDDIREMAAAMLKKVPIQVFVRNCETKQEVHVSVPQVIVIIAVVIVGCLLATGTGIDVYMTSNLPKAQDMGKVPQSLLAFSLRANIRQLFKSPRKNSMLLSVNGIRCLSLMWIVLAHTYGFGHRQGLARLSHAKTYMDDVLFQIITNAWVSVDTFFLLGGLLVAYSNLKSMEHTGGSIDFLSHVLHRVWRLTPPLAATLGVMFLLPMIGSGPLWADMVGQKVANCQKRWWQIFLPINTWIDFGSMCLLHTWYIAADMHFYCLAPVALIVLYRWPAIGFAFLFLLTAACSMITGLLTIAYDLPPTVIFFSPDVELTKRTANLIYFRPYPHVGAYCVGLALGYILWRYRKFSLSKLTQSAGWALSSASCLAVLFATYSWSRGQSAYPAEGVTYAVMHRTVWAAGVAWIVFVCATGHGGVLNKFLSWQLFGPLSKLCYSVYLLHFPVLWVRVSWRRSLLNFHHYDIVTEFFGILMITLGLSFIFHLAFEAPFLRLEQIWFPVRSKSTKIAKPLDDKNTT